MFFYKHRKILIVAFALLTAVAGFVFRHRLFPVVSRGSCAGFNVLFITLDTTRADHLGYTGYKQAKTPCLDTLAAKSFVFDNAVSQAPLTLPSHASMMTGRLPVAHGIRDNAGFFLDEKETTLAEIFKQAGYHTGAFVSSFVLDSSWRLDQGFDLYYDNFDLASVEDFGSGQLQRRAEVTEKEASQWIEQNKNNKFFCWVHFYDPHEPYDPPEPFKGEYSQHPYDGEIAYMDDVFGRLMKRLQDLELQERTIIIVAGDHGESLGEHGEATHSIFVYNATQRVPLLVYIPGKKPARIDDVVGLIDIAPTLLDLSGLSSTNTMQGTSLLAKINGREDRTRMVYSETLFSQIHYGWSPLQSLTTDEYRYIEAPRPELYAWRIDTAELKNLVEQKPLIAKALREQLSDTIRKESSGASAGPQEMDSETKERLQSLGYVSNAAAATPASLQVDPKDKIAAATSVQEASGLLLAGKQMAALRVVLPVVQADPDIAFARYIAGVAYAQTGQYAGAIEELQAAIRLAPENTNAVYNLALAYQAVGDLTSAEYWLKKMLEKDPDHLVASSKLGTVYMQMKRPDEAMPYFQKALLSYDKSIQQESSPKGKAGFYASAAEVYFEAGDLRRAAASLQMAIQLDPQRPSMHYNLAQVYEAAGSKQNALEEYRQETKVNPSSYQAFYNLGALYSEAGDYRKAAECFETVTRLNPRDPQPFKMLAAAYQKLGRNEEAQQILRSLPK